VIEQGDNDIDDIGKYRNCAITPVLLIVFTKRLHLYANKTEDTVFTIDYTKLNAAVAMLLIEDSKKEPVLYLLFIKIKLSQRSTKPVLLKKVNC
jgi:hypothetical protein